MKIINSWRKLAVFAVLALVGCAMLAGSRSLSEWESPQAQYYNQGLAYFKQGKVDEAMVAFDKSLDAYKRAERRSWVDNLLYPDRSVEWAALAQSKKAILYIVKQKPEMAVNAFKESIKLNPGGEQFLELTADQIKQLSEQSLVVKHNLELLFKKNPSMAQGEGKGKGKGKGQGQPKPGDDPGTQPGRGNRDDI